MARIPLTFHDIIFIVSILIICKNSYNGETNSGNSVYKLKKLSELTFRNSMSLAGFRSINVNI